MKLDGKKDDGWTSRAAGSRIGTNFFRYIINAFGLYPAYGTLFFAALQYTIADKRSKEAIHEFRKHLGFTTTFRDCFRQFYSYGLTLIDRHYFLSGNTSFFDCSSENENVVQREAARGNGIIMLGAHVGNWELAGIMLAERIGIPAHMFMYGKGAENGSLTNKAGKNLTVHHSDEDSPDTVVNMMNILRRGEIVCLHGDRFFQRQRRVRIDFLGEPAYFPAGPVAVAGISGAPIIPFYCIRTGLRKYLATSSEPVYCSFADRNDRDRGIHAALQQYVSSLEHICRRYPDQWYNFYRFWDTYN